MATNYKYLKENNLFEAHLRFKRAIGEALGYGMIEDADDYQNQQEDPNAQGGMPPAPGGQDPMGGGDPNGGMPPGPDAMGGAPDAQGGMPPGQDPMGGGDPNGGMPPGPDGEDTMGGAPDGGMPGMDGLDEEEPQEEDDVLDVDDLTDAQEEVNDKVNSVGRDLGKVDSKIENLIGAIEKLQGMFDKNNQEIDDLRKEFEKRNPTQTEKLNLRSLDSYPFVDKPTDFWGRKTANSNYSIEADNDNNDVDDFTEREIADSFSISDDLDQNLKKIFNLP